MNRFVIVLLTMTSVLAIHAQEQVCKAPHECTPTTMQTPQDRKPGNRPKFSPEDYRRYLEFFVSKECCLTDKEKEQFFPLLHEMLHKQRMIRMKQHELYKQTDNLTEKEYEQIVTKCAALDVEDKKIEQTYYKKFHSVLTWKKITKVRLALYKFQMEALRSFQPKDRNRR